MTDHLPEKDLRRIIDSIPRHEDRKQAEAQLRFLIESMRITQIHLADAQTLTHTGSWAWDVLRQRDIYWSEELFRIWGLDPKQGLAEAIPKARQRLHPEDLSKIIDSRQRAILQKIDFTLDFRILLPDGSMRYAHSVAHPVLDDRGDVVELMGTVMDVTQQHEARMVLQQAVDENRKLRDQLYRENVLPKEEIDQSAMFEEIVGRSPALQFVLDRIAKVARADSTVLITGETGTGKELIARAIHERSPRSLRPFVSINCAAIPPSLVVSELFGHEKGAFTGAVCRRRGRFELAEGGTIFLDEVGDLSAETQIALLRVLQEREFQRVGGHESIRSDVRVIAATNHNLESTIARGGFRRDLFYRLNVFPITVPPLRDRREDIPLLVQYFITRYANKAGKIIRNINKKTMTLLRSYPWPGNIRELQNVIERSVILSERETLSVDQSWLSPESFQSVEGNHTLSKKPAAEVKRMIEAALAETRGQVSGPSGAAAKLGIPPSTLDSKIISMKISKGRFKTKYQ